MTVSMAKESRLSFPDRAARFKVPWRARSTSSTSPYTGRRSRGWRSNCHGSGAGVRSGGFQAILPTTAPGRLATYTRRSLRDPKRKCATADSGQDRRSTLHACRRWPPCNRVSSLLGLAPQRRQAMSLRT